MPFFYNPKPDSTHFRFKLNNDKMSYILRKYTGKEKMVIIPSSFKGKPVTIIDEHAFAFCESITEVEIPNSIKEMRREIFFGCPKLIRVTIGSGLEKIYPDVFYGCMHLTEVCNKSSLNLNGFFVSNEPNFRISNIYNPSYGVSQVECFNDCYYYGVTDKTLILYVGDKSIIAIDTPKKIEKGAFYDCDNLGMIEIRNKDIEIDKGAFICSNLSYIYFNGKIEDWNRYQIDTHNEKVVIRCLDGIIGNIETF